MLDGLQAQTNFYQYLPAIILVLAFLEGNEVLAPSYLYALGVIITVARLSHVVQLFLGPAVVPMPFRMAGTLTTFAFLMATSTLLILLGLQVCCLTPLTLSYRTIRSDASAYQRSMRSQVQVLIARAHLI